VVHVVLIDVAALARGVCQTTRRPSCERMGLTYFWKIESFFCEVRFSKSCRPCCIL